LNNPSSSSAALSSQITTRSIFFHAELGPHYHEHAKRLADDADEQSSFAAFLATKAGNRLWWTHCVGYAKVGTLPICAAMNLRGGLNTEIR
jgi:hypothetical protein